ncbi:unnamed protein product [Linum tenue]|uniref:Uncharacterized protein n=1 Tax=Linum tenue TaxID=586396 RepID=A0AAV0IAA2_9ROSI|nr:unnamed protein product [Linum tenue]
MLKALGFSSPDEIIRVSCLTLIKQKIYKITNWSQHFYKFELQNSGSQSASGGERSLFSAIELYQLRYPCGPVSLIFCHHGSECKVHPGAWTAVLASLDNAAALVPEVVSCAEGSDEVAQKILVNGVQELALSAKAVV